MPGQALMPLPGGPSLSLVIATRNEAENVEALIGAICTALPGSDKELIFVDDSDDATPSLLQRFLHRANCPGLILQREGEERAGGLSTAVVAGFAVSSGTYLCNMDADLQHPVGEVPHLWSVAVREQADIVVASRFMPNASLGNGLANLQRHAVSRGSRLLARWLLPRARITSDPLSGFFLVHRRVVEGVHLSPVGYKILLEILVRGRWQQVLDIPYTFQARYAGTSKATARQGIQFLRHLASLVVAAHFGKRAVPAPAPAFSPVISEGAPSHRMEAEATGAQQSLFWRAQFSVAERVKTRLPRSVGGGCRKGLE
jgi:dolichol-phosphate mannosyltransferase